MICDPLVLERLACSDVVCYALNRVYDATISEGD